MGRWFRILYGHSYFVVNWRRFDFLRSESCALCALVLATFMLDFICQHNSQICAGKKSVAEYMHKQSKPLHNSHCIVRCFAYTSIEVNGKTSSWHRIYRSCMHDVLAGKLPRCTWRKDPAADPPSKVFAASCSFPTTVVRRSILKMRQMSWTWNATTTTMWK